MVEHWTDAIPDTPLRYMLLNLPRMASQRSLREPVWDAAMIVFHCGSNTAWGLCLRAGFDPETKLKDVR